MAGRSGFMITLIRESDRPYQVSTGRANLSVVANGEKYLPRDFMNESGNHITEKCRQYVLPLVRGEAPVTIGPDGLPEYVRFKRYPVEKKAGEFKV